MPQATLSLQKLSSELIGTFYQTLSLENHQKQFCSRRSRVCTGKCIKLSFVTKWNILSWISRKFNHTHLSRRKVFACFLRHHFLRKLLWVFRPFKIILKRGALKNSKSILDRRQAVAMSSIFSARKSERFWVRISDFQKFRIQSIQNLDSKWSFPLSIWQAFAGESHINYITAVNWKSKTFYIFLTNFWRLLQVIYL